MKLHWTVLRNLFVVVGFLVTYGSLATELSGVQVQGLSWAWYTLIGVTILLITLGITIVQLYLDNRNLRSQDKELERKKKQLEIEKLEWEKVSREDRF